MKNCHFINKCKYTISLILLTAFAFSLLNSLIAFDSVQVRESEHRIITLNVCHAGDASLSLNAESPLFVEFPPLALFIVDTGFKYPSYEVSALSQFPLPCEHPPEA